MHASNRMHDEAVVCVNERINNSGEECCRSGLRVTGRFVLAKLSPDTMSMFVRQQLRVTFEGHPSTRCCRGLFVCVTSDDFPEGLSFIYEWTALFLMNGNTLVYPPSTDTMYGPPTITSTANDPVSKGVRERTMLARIELMPFQHDFIRSESAAGL